MRSGQADESALEALRQRQAGQQGGDQRRARDQRRDEDVLVQRVGAVAERAEAVERRNAERRAEVAVGSAAGAPSSIV